MYQLFGHISIYKSAFQTPWIYSNLSLSVVLATAIKDILAAAFQLHCHPLLSSLSSLSNSSCAKCYSQEICLIVHLSFCKVSQERTLLLFKEETYLHLDEKSFTISKLKCHEVSLSC